MNPNRPTLRRILIKMERAKDKERILKAAREKQRVSYKGTPIRLSADFSTEPFSGQKGGAKYIQSAEREKPETKDTLPSKTIT